jgi:hypothetical protein
LGGSAMITAVITATAFMAIAAAFGLLAVVIPKL